MKFLWILIFVIAIDFTVKTLTKTEANTSFASRNSDADIAKHFNSTDLEKLGCSVDPALGKTTTIQNPIIGSMESYGINSQSGCVVLLISNILVSKKYDEGTWSGIQASHNILAERRSFDRADYEGNLGEHSQIKVFTQNGQKKGFSYTIQSKGFIRDVLLLSDDIEPDEKFESIFKEKL